MLRKMPNQHPEESVGIVSSRSHTFHEPLTLASGRVLPVHTLVYETYGTLNAGHSNAVLVCHAFVASSCHC